MSVSQFEFLRAEFADEFVMAEWAGRGWSEAKFLDVTRKAMLG